MTEAAPTTALRAGTLVGACLTISGFAGSSVSVALPSLREAYDFNEIATAWVLGAYVVGLSVSAPVYGQLADRFGPRRPLAVGFVLMVVGAVIAATAFHPAALYAGRVVQGVGGGCIPVLGAIVITARFIGADRSAGLARVSALAASSAGGVLLGGVVDAAFGWRAVLLIPVLIVFVAPQTVRIAVSRRATAKHDVVGVGLLTVAVVGVVLVLQGPSGGAAVVLGGAALLAGSMPLLAWHIRRLPHGLIPRAVVTNRVFVGSALPAMAIPASYFAGLVLVPAAIVARYGWGPVAIGAAMLPAAILGALLPRFVLRLPFPRPRLVAGGLAIAGVGLLVAAFAVETVVVLGFAFAAVTLAFGVAQGALLDRVATHVEGTQGQVIGTFSLFFFMGATIGSGVAGLVATVADLAFAFAACAALPFAAAAFLAWSWRSVEHDVPMVTGSPD